jgi:hypothetical protein
MNKQAAMKMEGVVVSLPICNFKRKKRTDQIGRQRLEGDKMYMCRVRDAGWRDEHQVTVKGGRTILLERDRHITDA